MLNILTSCAVRPSVCNKDVKFMKICTITLITMMTLALKVLAMFTLSHTDICLQKAVSGGCDLIYHYGKPSAAQLHNRKPPRFKGNP